MNFDRALSTSWIFRSFSNLLSACLLLMRSTNNRLFWAMFSTAAKKKVARLWFDMEKLCNLYHKNIWMFVVLCVCIGLHSNHNVTSKGASFVGFHHICHVGLQYFYIWYHFWFFFFFPLFYFEFSAAASTAALQNMHKVESFCCYCCLLLNSHLNDLIKGCFVWDSSALRAQTEFVV